MARTREFDVEEALEKATRLFWEKGYEATSIQDLVDATGVNRASLYQTFGCKRELFDKALRRFQCDTDRGLNAVGANAPPGLERIRAMFQHIAAETLGDPRGCLIVNSVTERAVNDEGVCSLGLKAREALERFFLRCLRDAEKRGEIESGRDTRALARFLTNTLFGLRLMAKMQPDRKLVDDIVNTALGAL